jgi:NADH dehydrogenase
MRILIAGGSGYVGRNIIKRFCKSNDFVNISLRNYVYQAVNNILIDLAKPLHFLQLDKPIDMIINCVECHSSNYDSSEQMKKAYILTVQNLIHYAKMHSIKYFIHFSINHINTVENDYQQAKFVAEGLVRNSNLQYAILKPSVIFGQNSPFDYLMDSVLKRVVLFRFWNDEAKLAPIHINDVLSNLNYLMRNDNCWCESYNLTGPETLGFEEMLYRYFNNKKQAVHQPPSSIAYRKTDNKPTILNAPFSILKQSILDGVPQKLRLLIELDNDENLSFAKILIKPKLTYFN